MNYKELTNLVSNNDFDKVFEVLNLGIPNEQTDLSSELSIIEGNYKSFKKKERLGVISNEDANVERNKIAFSTLELIETVKKKLT
jgi:hypothetical protein